MSKILSTLAQTREKSLLLGKVFIGLALGLDLFGGNNSVFGLISSLQMFVISIFLWTGILLLVRGRKTIDEENHKGIENDKLRK